MIDHYGTGTSPTPSTSWQQWFKHVLVWPWEVMALIAFFGWLYRQTMPPALSSWIVKGLNPAVLQITGSTWGIPPSPGYPLYTILTNLLVRYLDFIPGFNETLAVWRVSFSSTLTSLLTLALLYFIIRQLTRNRIMAFMMAAVLGISLLFWQAAIMAQIYSFNTLIFALTFWLALYWDCHPRQRWLVLLGLVLGVGATHHGTTLVLMPTIAVWVALARDKNNGHITPANHPPRWQGIARRWGILAGCAAIPLLSALYVPWVVHNRATQSWFGSLGIVGFTQGWWGQLTPPIGLIGWLNGLMNLFWQQAEQITWVGVILGLAGLLTMRRNLWLFGLPFLALVFWAVFYTTPQINHLLIPLTFILVVGLGVFLSLVIRIVVTWLIRFIRLKDKNLRGNKWISTTLRIGLSVGVALGLYFAYRPLARANYNRVNLSADWQAVDLVEEISAIAAAGTPLTIIGQENTILPQVVYTQLILKQAVEPLSTTTLRQMTQSDSITLLRSRLEQNRRLLIDIATIDQNIIPWLSRAIAAGQILLAPTGHPYLWELLPRPMSNVLPEAETWTLTPAGAFLDGKVSMIAFQQQLVRKPTGCFLRLTLFWRVETTPLAEDYFVAVQPLGGETVLDKNDHLALMRGYLPFSTLTPGEIVRDEVDMLVRQPAALPGTNLVVNLYQVRGDQYPTYGEITLPITVDSQGCSR